MGARVDERSDASDLIFANAVLQWVPGHAALFPALAAKLAPRGCLAVQVPDNLDEPAQTLMREIAEHGSWADKLAGADRSRVRIEPAWSRIAVGPQPASACRLRQPAARP